MLARDTSGFQRSGINKAGSSPDLRGRTDHRQVQENNFVPVSSGSSDIRSPTDASVTVEKSSGPHRLNSNRPG